MGFAPLVFGGPFRGSAVGDFVVAEPSTLRPGRQFTGSTSRIRVASRAWTSAHRASRAFIVAASRGRQSGSSGSIKLIGEELRSPSSS